MGQTGRVQKFHKFLAAYFISISHQDNTWVDSTPRAYRAIVYHLLSANCLREMAVLFCSLQFLSAACAAGVAADILQNVRDYIGSAEKHDRSLRHPSSYELEGDPLEKSLDDYVKFLSSSLDILNRFPYQIYQQALNEPEGSSVELDLALKRQKPMHSFQWLTKSEKPHPCYLHLTDFSQEILCITSSSDGEHLALGGQDALVHVLNSDTGKLVRTCTGHAQAVGCLCFVGANKLCSGSHDGTLSLWDIIKGIRITVLTGHKKRVSDCCSDSTGNTIVSVSWDHTVRVWSGRDGREITCISKNKCPLNSVAFHPSKQLVVTGGWDKTVKMWDLQSMNRRAVLRGHSSSVQSVTFSPNGLYVASGDLYGKIFVWSSNSGAMLSQFGGHLRSVGCLSFLDDGNKLVSGSHDGTLKIWGNHWHTSVSRWKISKKVTIIHIVSLHHVAVGYQEGTVTVYDIKNGAEVWTDSTSNDAVSCIANFHYHEKCGESIIEKYIHDKRTMSVLTGTESGTIRISMKKASRLLGKTKGCITAAAYKKYIVVAGNVNGQIAVFDTSLPEDTCYVGCVEGHQGKVTCCCFTSSDSFITTATDKCIRIWQLVDGIPLPDGIVSNAHDDWIITAAYNNNLLVTGSRDSNIKLWNLDSKVNELQFSLGDSVAFLTVEGDYIFAGGANGSVGVWTRGGKIVSFQAAAEETPKCNIGYFFKIENQNAEKRETVYSGYIANLEENGELVIRKPFSHSQMATLERHTSAVTGCTTLKSGNIISSSVDGSLRFWSIPEARLTPYHAQEKIVVVGISQNGKTAFSCDRNGLAFIWMVRDSKLIYYGSTDVSHEGHPIFGFALRIPIDRFTLKAKGDYSVTSATFVHPEGRMFLCGERRQNKNFLQIYKSKPIGQLATYVTSNKIGVPSEVTDVHWHHVNNSILASLKSGCVIITDPKLSKTMTIRGSSNWSLAARMSSPLSIYIAANRTVKEFVVPSSIWPSVITSKPKTKYKATENESVIISSMEIEDGVIYTGDTVGVLTIRTGDSQQSIMVHKDCIIGIQFWDKFMFTGSKDGTVKAWLRKELQQVGLFTFHATVTSLSVGEATAKGGNCANLLVGTSSGETHLLLWWAK